MVLKKTSADGFVFPRSENPKGAFLADFDIDGASLKKDHREWLEENVVRPVKAKGHGAGGWQIELSGRASKSGSDEHNMWLSDQRLRAVAQYLDSNLTGMPVMFIPRVLGESSPYVTNDFEHELDRSVEVTARYISTRPPKRVKPHILIPKVRPWKPRPDEKVTNFTLQVMKAKIYIAAITLNVGPLMIGNGTAFVKMYVKIGEVGTGEEAFYELEAEGPGTIIGAEISLRKLKPGLGLDDYSAEYTAGDPHPFSTDVEMDAEDFTGPVTFMFGALGDKLAFGPKDGVFGKQSKIRGLSFGIGDEDLMKYAEGTTFGKMKLVDAEPSWP